MHYGVEYLRWGTLDAAEEIIAFESRKDRDAWIQAGGLAQDPGDTYRASIDAASPLVRNWRTMARRYCRPIASGSRITAIAGWSACWY